MMDEIDMIDMIDMLVMLKDKTKGNISDDESKILDQSISELKMNYVKTNERNFLPIYTEPVINKYSKINVAFKIFKENKNIYFFKGDGDQDRPNKI